MTDAMRALVRAADAERMHVWEIPVGQPRDGQILVEVKVSAVNEMDVQVRSGGWDRYVKKYLKQSSVVTGFEFSGVARSSGKRIKEGERIIGYVHVLNGPRCHSEFVWVDENDVHVMPDSWSFDDGAALTVMGLTATEIIEDICPLTAKSRVAIIGAAGGVGAYTLQLAKFRGGHVTAVCSQKSYAWASELGADEMRASRNENMFKPTDAFDLIVDTPCTLSFTKAAPFLAPGGVYVNTNPLADLGGYIHAFFSSRKAGYLMMLSTKPEKMRRFIDLVELGAMKPVIDSKFDLAEADKAFDRFATSGKQGRVLLQISQ
jgi:NADPH:quinone reductase